MLNFTLSFAAFILSAAFALLLLALIETYAAENILARALLITVSYISLFNFLIPAVNSPGYLHFLIKASSMWSFIFPVLIHFILAFTDKDKWLKKKATYIVIYLPAAVLSVLLMARHIPASKISKDLWINTLLHLSALELVCFYLLIIMAVSAIILLFIFIINTQNRNKKQTGTVFAAAFLLPFLPYLLHAFSGSKIPDFSGEFLVLSSFLVLYGVLSYSVFATLPLSIARLILLNMNDFIMLCGASGKIKFANQKLLNLSGFSEEEIVGKFYKDIISMGNKFQNIELRIKHGAEFEAVLTAKYGRKIPVSIRVTESRRKTKLLFIGKDISGIKAYEYKLLDAAAAWRDTFDSIHDPIYILEKNIALRAATKHFPKC